MLRGRYMIAQFHIGRPYLYKALRLPSKLTDDDYEQIRRGLRNAMDWPVTCGVFTDMKSCIPIKFAFCSQYVSILRKGCILLLTLPLQVLWPGPAVLLHCSLASCPCSGDPSHWLGAVECRDDVVFGGLCSAESGCRTGCRAAAESVACFRVMPRIDMIDEVLRSVRAYLGLGL